MGNSHLDHFEENGGLIREIESLDHLRSAPKKVMMFTEDPRMGLLGLIDNWLPQQYEGTRYDIIDEFESFKVAELHIMNDKKRDKEYTCPDCGSSIKEEELEKQGINGKILLIFPLDDDKPFFYMVTNKSSTNLTSDLSFFNSLYPLISRVVFRSHHIKEVLEDLEDRREVKVKNYVAKRYYGDKTTTEKHEKEGVSVSRAFSKARKDDTWIDSIACKIDGVTARISREGRVHYQKGYRYGQVYRDLLKPLFSKSEQLYSSIVKKKDNSSIDSIVYTTKNPVFVSPEAGEELINIVSSKKKFEVARLNRNIKMPELLVKDYKSGSSYALNVISKSKISITPKTQVTEISMNSILNNISKQYEGELEWVTE